MTNFLELRGNSYTYTFIIEILKSILMEAVGWGSSNICSLNFL